jgi:MFS family permease
MQKTELQSAAEPVIKRELVKGKADSLITTSVLKTLNDGLNFKEVNVDTVYADVTIPVGHAKTAYLEKKLPTNTFWQFVFLVFLQILFVTMVYGPVAAFLVELFPTKIRYTSMSLPYHIGNGVFGGLVPFIATLITSFKGSTPLSGLWYPITVASICIVIGTVYVSNKIDRNVMD